MYASRNGILQSKQVGTYEEEEGPPAPNLRIRRSGFAGDEYDYFNRDMSLFMGVPPELETASSDTNSEYASSPPAFSSLIPSALAGIRRGLARAGMGDAGGAVIGTAILGPGVGTLVGGVLPIGGLLKPSSASSAKGPVGQLVSMAQSGNAAAAYILNWFVQYHGAVASERAVWAAGLNTLDPALVQAAIASVLASGRGLSTAQLSAMPGIAQAAAWAQGNNIPFQAGSTVRTSGSGGVPGSPNQPIAGVSTAGLFGSGSTGLLLGLGLLGAFAVSRSGGRRRGSRRGRR